MQGRFDTFEKALPMYQRQIFMRTDPDERRKSGTKKLKVTHLLSGDANTFNVDPNGKRVHDRLLFDIKEEHLRIVAKAPRPKP